jgi:hypothetical protein
MRRAINRVLRKTEVDHHGRSAPSRTLGLRRGSGSGCDARHLLTGRSIRAESILCRCDSARTMRADAVPNAASPRVKPRTMRFSQTRQGAFLPTPPAPPHSVRSPERQKARPSESYSGRAPQRAGPTNGNNDIEPPSTSISYMFIIVRSGHIFNRGLSGDNWATKGPPPLKCIESIRGVGVSASTTLTAPFEGHHTARHDWTHSTPIGKLRP